MCALEDNAVKCWGSRSIFNPEEMLEKDYLQISLGQDHACAAASDGKLQCWKSGADFGAHRVPTGLVLA